MPDCLKRGPDIYINKGLQELTASENFNQTRHDLPAPSYLNIRRRSHISIILPTHFSENVSNIFSETKFTYN